MLDHIFSSLTCLLHFWKYIVTCSHISVLSTTYSVTNRDEVFRNQGFLISDTWLTSVLRQTWRSYTWKVHGSTSRSYWKKFSSSKQNILLDTGAKVVWRTDGVGGGGSAMSTSWVSATFNRPEFNCKLCSFCQRDVVMCHKSKTNKLNCC
jgi:hypothetical protein